MGFNSGFKELTRKWPHRTAYVTLVSGGFKWPYHKR